MTDRDLRKNAEGYSDPTAYEAMKNLDRDDERFHKLLHTIFDTITDPSRNCPDHMIFFSQHDLFCPL